MVKKKMLGKEEVRNSTTPSPIKTISGDLLQDKCENCGEKATIVSNKGRKFCCLACQTTYGD
jgi:ribosomal protein S27E